MLKESKLIKLQKFIGRKWTLEILNALKTRSMTYNEIKRHFNKEINTTLLSQRLKTLMEFKLIRKTDYDNKIVYILTKEEMGFDKIQNDLKNWIKKSK